jgi:hypothetical protein
MKTTPLSLHEKKFLKALFDDKDDRTYIELVKDFQEEWVKKCHMTSMRPNEFLQKYCPMEVHPKKKSQYELYTIMHIVAQKFTLNELKRRQRRAEKNSTRKQPNDSGDAKEAGSSFIRRQRLKG